MTTNPKIALVKQDVYGDLYVCPKNAEAAETLFSSLMRVGPIGLKTLLNADFIIVNEEKDTECQIWTELFPDKVRMARQLKYKPMREVQGREFLRPGSDLPHSQFAIKAESIDWSIYDIVISLNVSVPYRIVKQYPSVLWCYMMGETSPLMDQVYFGYDVSLNQLCRGEVIPGLGSIDFPYTFTGQDCLERIMEGELMRPSENHGIFAEINTTTSRPVREVPHFKPLQEQTGHPIRIHQQAIKDNLKEVYDAKYFIKVGGRPTRGNSVIEAISLGTVVLMDPADCTHSQLLPSESWITSVEEAVEKVKFLDKNRPAYQNLLQHQRQLVKQFVVDTPLRSLNNALQAKLHIKEASNYRNAPIFSGPALRSRIKQTALYKMYKNMT